MAVKSNGEEVGRTFRRFAGGVDTKRRRRSRGTVQL